MNANSKKLAFLQSIPRASIELPDNTIARKSKFNFSYFSKQPTAGQSYSDWSHDELVMLCEKLQIFSGEPLTYWEKNARRQEERARFGNIFEIPRKKQVFRTLARAASGTMGSFSARKCNKASWLHSAYKL
jgi:hypothetical protein